jgi:hypothetical protein
MKAMVVSPGRWKTNDNSESEGMEKVAADTHSTFPVFNRQKLSSGLLITSFNQGTFKVLNNISYIQFELWNPVC